MSNTGKPHVPIMTLKECMEAEQPLSTSGQEIAKPRPIDGKFGFIGQKIVNLVSGQEIPEDEPLFLLRARDHYALAAIHAYQGACEFECNELHLAGIQQVREKFCQFQANHPERMKQPGITRHLKLEAHSPAVQALESQWIRTSEIDKLPTHAEEVRIRLRDGSELNGAILQSDGDWWWAHKFFDESIVTHWRNLPAPPVESLSRQPQDLGLKIDVQRS